MKKLIFAILIMMPFVGLFAQEGSDYKPDGGFVLGVNFTPLEVGGNVISIDNINGRYFLNSGLAVRVGLGLSTSKDSYDNGLEGNANETSSKSTSEFSFSLGAEKHFAGTERLSPYIGADLGLSMASAKAETTIAGVTSTIEGASDATGADRKHTTFGLNLVAGADFYVAKHLYLGVEIKYGFAVKSEGEYTVSSGGLSVTSKDKPKNTTIGQMAQPSLKLGFKF